MTVAHGRDEMSRLVIRVNGKRHVVKASPNTPLLYVLRNELRLNGPRFGCGLAQCGACTVHLDGKAIRSCVTPAIAAAHKPVTTLEGLGTAKQAAPRPEGVRQPPGRAMRLLHERHDHGLVGVPEAEPASHRGRDQEGAVAVALPLRNSLPDRRGRQGRGEGDGVRGR